MQKKCFRFKLVVENAYTIFLTFFFIHFYIELHDLIDQKWKKTCSTTLRKSKQSVTNENVLSSNINKNQNNDNSITDVNRNNFQWKEQSL